MEVFEGTKQLRAHDVAERQHWNLQISARGQTRIKVASNMTLKGIWDLEGNMGL